MQPSNAEPPIEVTPSGIVNSVRLPNMNINSVPSLLNMQLSELLYDALSSSIITDSRLSQSLKVETYKLVTPLPIVIDSNALLIGKSLSDVKPSPITNVFTLSQPSNVELAISVTPLGIVTFAKLVQPSNAE